MRVSLLAVGRLKGPEREIAGRYETRLPKAGRPLGLDWRGTIELPESRASSASARKDAEAGALLARLDDGAVLIALDEGGAQPGSEAFAALLARHRDAGAPSLALAIGGADGHGDALLERAGERIAFGRMTWPHGLVRAMALEQLYRAATILAGHPYHRS